MANPPIDRDDLKPKINAEFQARDPAYSSKATTLGNRLTRLNTTLQACLDAHHILPASQQMALEAQWLINYTDDWARATSTLDRLEASLGGDDQPPLAQGVDGSWAPGGQEWYRKLEPTVDALQRDELTATALRPLLFMKPLQDPKFTIAYLESLRVSRIRDTGRNNRDEFGAAITALSQLIFKPALRALLLNRPELGFQISPELDKQYTDWLWKLQSPLTGFWGPTYHFPDGDIEVQDVSFTFHVVHYISSDPTRTVPNLPLIGRTALAIKKMRYPNGWVVNKPERGPPLYSDHNNYDIATLFSAAWSRLDDSLRDQARPALQEILTWCLTNSLNDDRFVLADGATEVDAYYYGTRFLDAIGFWQPANAFWTTATAPMKIPATLPPPLAVVKKLFSRFEAQTDDRSEEAETVRKVLLAALTA
jgi:hypothetical protein